jgi:L-fuculose-phosphate aldolase
MTDSDQRATLVAAAQELERLGLNHGSAGNLSLRAGAMALITPSGVPTGALTPETIACMPLAGVDGAWEGPLPPSSEWRFHLDILRARPDVNAVVHTHSPYATTLAVMRREIPAVHYMIAAFGGPTVRCVDYAMAYCSPIMAPSSPAPICAGLYGAPSSSKISRDFFISR